VDCELRLVALVRRVTVRADGCCRLTVVLPRARYLCCPLPFYRSAFTRAALTPIVLFVDLVMDQPVLLDLNL